MIPSRRATAPHNIEAEQALLGAILVNNVAYEKVGEILQPEHFYDPVHGRIYGAISTLINRGQIADPKTLRGLFNNDPAFGRCRWRAISGRSGRQRHHHLSMSRITRA